MQQIVPAILGAALVMMPLAARAADLVVWWEKGYYPQEDQAVRETVAAFERGTGKQVELVQPTQDEMLDRAPAALEARQPPDFLFGTFVGNYISEWAFDDRLADLTDAIGFFSNLFDPDALAWYVLLNQKTGKRALYALPIGRTTNNVHVWKSLLAQAGFTLEDIPRQWEAFWSFWCDQVQPAVRRATGRDDVWGIGLHMSGQAPDTQNQFFQFVAAYEADYVTQKGRLIIDDPGVRRKLIKVVDSYTAIYRKGCTPPDSITWADIDNNKKFHAQAVIMTPNNGLSLINALKRERHDDYYENSATIEWPLGPDGEAFRIMGALFGGVVFKDGRNVGTAREFVRFLVGEGWLPHYLDFSGERFLPPMPKLLDAPFWLDPSDPHRMASVMQIAARPMQYDYATVSGNRRYDQIWRELVWAKTVHRVAAEGFSPEQAVDEAIARIKQILAE
jgi:multiple sugar transport system substrate-binding protein